MNKMIKKGVFVTHSHQHNLSSSQQSPQATLITATTTRGSSNYLKSKRFCFTALTASVELLQWQDWCAEEMNR
jgi:hypothetical protein